MSETRIDKKPLPDHPGYVGYQITADTYDAVQAEITRIMNDANVLESEFRTPTRTGGKYVSRGYVRPKIGIVSSDTFS